MDRHVHPHVKTDVPVLSGLRRFHDEYRKRRGGQHRPRGQVLRRQVQEHVCKLDYIVHSFEDL